MALKGMEPAPDPQ